MSITDQQVRAIQDRWTVLSYDPDLNEYKGRIAESWLCVDCGVNTAPGYKTRKEVELAHALHGGDEPIDTDDQEVYHLTQEVWQETGLEGWGGCLCIGCCEKRIGRLLKATDFLPGHPFNALNFPASRRLRRRRIAR